MFAFFIWNQALPQDSSSVDRKIEQGPSYKSETLRTQYSLHENHLPPLYPCTWKKPTMTKGLYFTKSATSSLLLNRGALWRTCLLNQTTKAVDSTTSEETFKGIASELFWIHGTKVSCLEFHSLQAYGSTSIFFYSQTPRHECINSS